MSSSSITRPSITSPMNLPPGFSFEILSPNSGKIISTSVTGKEEIYFNFFTNLGANVDFKKTESEYLAQQIVHIIKEKHLASKKGLQAIINKIGIVVRAPLNASIPHTEGKKTNTYFANIMKAVNRQKSKEVNSDFIISLSSSSDFTK